MSDLRVRILYSYIEWIAVRRPFGLIPDFCVCSAPYQVLTQLAPPFQVGAELEVERWMPRGLWTESGTPLSRHPELGPPEAEQPTVRAFLGAIEWMIVDEK